MCELTTQYVAYIAQINEQFEQLKCLTNDDLRRYIGDIQHEICAATDKLSALNDVMIPVYAMVKETARRFSEGKIVVTANSNDIALAKRYDFVTVQDGLATYANHWDVDGVSYYWNMVHYDEQLLAGINLHFGNAIEMATGEGKTLVATLPTFLNALSHEGVHVMTVNDYLSKRDYQITRPLYLFYGLSVECIEVYDRHEYGRKLAYDADITFGSNSSFVFDYLFDHLAVVPTECVQRNHNFAIIDEIDSILIDDAETPHVVSGGTPYYCGDIYKEYFPVVRELLEKNLHALCEINRINKAANFTDEGKNWLCERLSIPNLFYASRTYEIADFNDLTSDEQDQVRKNITIQNVLHQILLSLTVYEKDVDYVIVDKKIKIIDHNTGRIKELSRWSHGLHTAIELKEDVKMQPDSDGLAVISLKNYFKLYKKVSGMSGSIYPVREELKTVYGLGCAIIPTHKPCIRKDHTLQIFKTSRAKDAAIINNIIQNSQEGRPTLIGTLSLKRADEIESQLRDANLTFNRLDARNTKDEAFTVAKAGIGNTITLSTSIAGRGTDIKPSDDALVNGGLCVIGTDLFGSVRTDLQLRGRTGRQGNPGSSIFFASLEDDILEYLSASERNDLQALATTIHGDDVSTDEIRKYFDLAQSKREQILKNHRKETALKDDVIAPHRAKFYERRNKALFDSNFACGIVDNIVGKDNEPQAVDKTSTLYSITCALVRRSKRNNVNRAYILVPYSAIQQPFAIQFDVDLLLTSKDYFTHEFKRQNLLQIYDKFWKEFVMYLMRDLDKHEIQALRDIYSQMMDHITMEITNRILKAVPLFNIEDNEYIRHEHKYRANDNTLARRKKPTSVSPNNPCPCGSGIRYCDCHGVKSNSRFCRKR